MLSIPYCALPWFITIILLCLMFRPIKNSGGDFGGSFYALFRLFYIVPISITWTIFFAVRYHFHF